MKNTKQIGYLAPEVEVIKMVVEQGFNGSLGGNDSNVNKPTDDPEIEDENAW